MTPGIHARLDRIGTDHRYVVVPMDHGVTLGAVEGLTDIETTIDAVTGAGADAVLTQKGIAPRVHPNRGDAGYIVHLNASTVRGPDTNDKRRTGTVEEALRVGADAVSYHLNVGSTHEPDQLETLATVTDTAHRYGVPVLVMAYPRGPDINADNPTAIAHAVRIAEELGADLVKTPYADDSSAFEEVTAATRLPVLIAGGEPSGDTATLDAVAGAMTAGAAGVSIGRSVFQHDDPAAMTRAVSAIVHEGQSPDEAIRTAELDADRNH